VAVLGYAWTDGGRQPVRDIDVSLPIPQHEGVTRP